LAGLGLVLAGAAFGFLPWNAPSARVFLGDVGSYGLGLLVAAMSVWAVAAGMPWHWAVAPLIVYGADTGWAILKRRRAGHSLTEAHREHAYQRLVDGGWVHLASAALCTAATVAVCVLCAAGGTQLQWWVAVLSVAVAFLYLCTPSLLLREVRA
jgi:UDP-N-acetylmuramyl pentapeptide phosphotransferase/UDP-N-acetylglucosamine-1-phosphate transferase